MLSRLFLIFLRISMVVCELKAAIVYGIPKIDAPCVENFVPLKECYQACMGNNSCVLAFWNHFICWSCGANDVTSVEKNNFNGTNVIFKYNDTSEQCPIDSNHFSDAFGSVTGAYDNSTYDYEIKGNQNEWQLTFINTQSTPFTSTTSPTTSTESTTSPTSTTESTTYPTTTTEPPCDAGWEYFPRINCGWCIKVFNQLNSSFAECQNICSSENSQLTGMENTNESQYIAEIGKSFGYNVASQRIFVDGTRKAICNTSETLNDCPITFSGSFDFRDPCASNQNGYVPSSPGVPNGNGYSGYPEGNLVVYAPNDSSFGLSDDVTGINTLNKIGCACGKYSKFQPSSTSVVQTSSTTQSTPCDEGWEFFQRIKTGWCIKVTSSLNIAYSDAQIGCEAEDAVLTGLENTNEASSIAIASAGFTNNSTTGTQSVWVDGTRKAECNTTETVNNCNKTFVGSFNFHDTWASSQNGYIPQASGIPDGAIDNAVPQGCLWLYILPETRIGTADDAYCGRQTSNNQIIGYACGKPSKY